MLNFNNCGDFESQGIPSGDQDLGSQGSGSSPDDPVNPVLPLEDEGSQPSPPPGPGLEVVFPSQNPVAANSNLCSVTANDSPLKVAARKLSPGEWVKVSTEYDASNEYQFFRNVPYYPDKRGNNAHITWADSAVWDEPSGCLYYYGGGHGSAPAYIRMCEGDMKWNYGQRPPALKEQYDKPPSYGAMHIYDSNTMDHARRLHFFPDNLMIHAFDIAKQEWFVFADIPRGIVNVSAHMIKLEFVPGLGLTMIVGAYSGGNKTHLYDENTKTWSVLHPSLSNIARGYMPGQYNPTSKIMVFGGGSAPGFKSDINQHIWKMTPDGAVSKIKHPPVAFFTSAASTGGYFVDDPASGNFIYLGQDEKIHEYITSKDQWIIRGDAPFKSCSECRDQCSSSNIWCDSILRAGRGVDRL